MGTAKGDVSVKVLCDILHKPKCTSDDNTTQTVTDETYPSVGGEVNILKVSNKLDSQSLSHRLYIILCPALIGTADKDFSFEPDL
jgi:hypothetical protein